MAALSLVVVLAGIQAPAAAAPDDGGTAAPPPVTASPAGVPPTRITLITGDTVTFSRDGAGRVAVTVDPRPDGTPFRYRALTEGDDYYLIPAEAEAYVDAGMLDRELFNLPYLAANGYGDEESSTLPLIVRYHRAAPASVLADRAEDLPGEEESRPLPAVDGAAVAVDKAGAADFWSEVVGDAAGVGVAAAGTPGTLGHGVAQVWLDAKVATLDETSTPQIGAPTAWAAGLTGSGVDIGIIDTGIDLTHPDLAGKVVAARNFVPADLPGGGDPEDVTDRHGHGTHVAGIAAGTGAASGGRHTGVAPEAGLIVAKALSDTGTGYMSSVIEAMEWMAATQHARVVNLSLGSGPTDGTDPASVAVDTLTAEYGTLFVIAAGNDGPSARTVSSPGAATAALTVGAVDRNEQLASFSSRGPRWGDGAIKPEITAPGVDITAARAAGTALGPVVDEFHVVLSGTSMATPHVAGAAAILAQQHPDWTPQQLKNALVGTAVDGGHTAYEQGAGRVDVARAVTQRVFHDTASIAAEREPVTRTVTYRNEGAAAVTLTLSADLTRLDGVPAPEGMVTLSARTLTVPAGGTAAVDVTVDPTAGELGTYTGHLVATGSSGERLTVPLAARKGVPYHTLTIRVVAYPLPVVVGNFGNAKIGAGCALLVNDDDPALQGEPAGVCAGWEEVDDRVYQATLPVPEGVYHVGTWFTWYDNLEEDSDAWYRTYELVRPQVVLDGDTTIEFDLTGDDVVPVRVETPRPSMSIYANEYWNRVTAGGREWYGGGTMGYPYSGARGTLHLSPGEAATVGSFRYTLNDTRIAPEVEAVLHGRGRIDLRPVYIDSGAGVPRFASDQHLAVVSEAHLRSGGDVRGKLVLSDRYPGCCEGSEPYHRFLTLATQAGAAGVLTDSGWAAGKGENRIPVLWIDKTVAAQARAVVDGPGPARVHLRSQLVTPYKYNLNHHLEDRIPRPVEFSYGEPDLAAVVTTYHGQYAQVPGVSGVWGDVGMVAHTYAPGQHAAVTSAYTFVGQRTLTEYFNVTGPDVLWVREYTFNDPDDLSSVYAQSHRAFRAATDEVEHWNEPILPAQVVPGPGMPAVGPSGPDTGAFLWPCHGCRQGDRLRVRPLAGPLFAGAFGQLSAAGDPSHLYQLIDMEVDDQTRLFRGDTEVTPQYDEWGLPYYEVPAEPDTYRFHHVFRNLDPTPHAATTVETTWTFRSGRPDADRVTWPHGCLDGSLFGDTQPCDWLPLIYLHYQLGLAADDSAPAGRPHHITVSAQQGPTADPVPLTRLKVWASADGGQTWRPAVVTPRGGDTYGVLVHNPSLEDSPTGTVMLRAEAVDAHGNRVEQVITDAYRLVEPGPAGPDRATAPAGYAGAAWSPLSAQAAVS